MKIVGGGDELFVREIPPGGFRDEDLIAVDYGFRRRRAQLGLFPPHVFARELVAREERDDGESPHGFLLDRVDHFVPLETVVVERRNVRRCRR